MEDNRVQGVPFLKELELTVKHNIKDELALTKLSPYGIISSVLFLERYRSGHNGAVLKTVVSQGTVGSNPTLSAIRYHTRSMAL